MLELQVFHQLNHLYSTLHSFSCQNLKTVIKLLIVFKIKIVIQFWWENFNLCYLPASEMAPYYFTHIPHDRWGNLYPCRFSICPNNSWFLKHQMRPFPRQVIIMLLWVNDPYFKNKFTVRMVMSHKNAFIFLMEKLSINSFIFKFMYDVLFALFCLILFSSGNKILVFFSLHCGGFTWVLVEVLGIVR